MITRQRTLHWAVAAGVALAIAGCDRGDSAQTAGRKLDKAGNELTARTSEAADKAAVVMDDSAITAKVKAAILAEPGLRSLQIGVATKDSIVTLTGTVDSPQLKSRAGEVAGSVAGVRSVVDNIVSKSTQSG